jgi:molybdopterin converting factor small subunit
VCVLRVKTKALGWLRQEGANQEVVELDDRATLIKALRILFKQSVLERIVRNGRISNQVIVLVNGVDANLIGGLEAELKDGDELTLIPVVHGG